MPFVCKANIYRPSIWKVQLGRPNLKQIQLHNFIWEEKKYSAQNCMPYSRAPQIFNFRFHLS